MHGFPKILAAAILFLSTLAPHSFAQARFFALTVPDRQVAFSATSLAGRHPGRALRWLEAQRRVASVVMGADRKTLEVHFRDGADLVILPRVAALHRAPPQFGPRTRLRDPVPNAAGRALVLEPFADELNLSDVEGQAEANSLSGVGFQVTTLRNDAVTVGVMQTLSNYSVVYMLTHSGVLPNGDAIVVTGEVSPAQPQQSPYAALYTEHSLLQATVAGESQPILYNAITSIFVDNHLGTFPNSSLIFLNGCQVLDSPVLWKALQAKNLGALVSWTDDADSNTDVQAGKYVVSQLAAGATLAGAVQSAQAEGVAISFVSGKVAHLGFLGDGSETLARALTGAQAAPPTATATAIPTSTPIPKKTARHGRCKPGHHRSHGRCVRTRHKHRHCKKRCKRT